VNTLKRSLTPPEASAGQATKSLAETDEFLTASELTARLKMGRGALRRHMVDGKIPYLKLGPRRYHFHWPTVAAALVRMQRGMEAN